MTTVPAPLRIAAFRWFFAARTASFLGSSMVPVALAFAVLDISASASALGIVLAARSIPMAAFMLVGGVVSDRLSRSQVLVVSNLLTGLTQGVAAWLLISGHAEVWSLAVVEAVNGTVAAFTFPATNSVVPMIVERSDLQQANAVLGFSRHGTYILGPSVAALLVVSVGSGWAIAVDAVSFLVAAACTTRLRLPRASTGPAESMLADLREGWSAFTGLTWVWVVVAAFGVMNMLESIGFLTLGPVVARDTVGERAWGLSLSVEAVGFLLMSVVLLKVTLRHPLRIGMVAVSAMVLPMAVLGLAPSVWLLVAVSLVSGAGIEVFSIGWSTAMQEHVPNEVLSRVTSYDALGSFVAIPAGQLLAGPLAALFGERAVMVGCSVALVVVVGLALCSRSVRDLEHAPVHAP
ncbi:MFS transporter [Solicola sp. PLA-1-18]|uniref:MFS transporter n=1 Tax=Solicola sp. PLA-1-18 TaxID=3380532 RepID=UPI003B7DF588